MKKYIYLMICLVGILSLFCSCKKNLYTVTINYENGTQEVIEKIKKDSAIKEPAHTLPNEVKDIKYFDELGNEFSFENKINNNLTLQAIYVYNEYVINFYDYDNSLIETYTLPYGSSIIFPKNPTRAPEEGCAYIFEGWGTTETVVTKDLDLTAQYKKVLNEYVISFYDYDNSLIETYTLPYGSSIIFPENPTRAPEEGCTYIFEGWGITETVVTKDLDLTAQYKKVLNEYIISFYDYDNSLIETYTLPYGSSIIFPENPTRAPEEGCTYIFEGWGTTETVVTKDLDLTAQYKKVLNEYVISFYNYDKSLIETYKLTHGSEIIFPEDPTRPGGEGYSYVFKDWGLKQTIATKDLNFTARFIKVYDEMTVTLLNVDNTVYEIEKCDYDSYINSYEEPEFEKDSNKYYRFLGWYDIETDELFDFDIEIKKDYTLYPKYDIYNYEETTLENATISFIGDSISTFYSTNSSVNSLYGGTNQFYYPIYSATVKTVDLTWWHQTYTQLGLKLGVNNSWSGSAAYGSGASAGMSENRLKTLGDNGTPNIVIIFLGTNDNVNGHTVVNLKLAYETMINYITKNYVDFSNNTAKIPYIYLFTNGYAGYSSYNYTEERRLEYNAMFKDLANSYDNVRIFDLAKYITKDNYSSYLGDALHYNADGMKLISSMLVETLRNDFSKTKKLNKQRSNNINVVYYLEKEEKNY